MKIKEILYWNRNDFKAVFHCEKCGNEFEKFGYGDDNYYNNVVPNAICPECGLNSHGENKERLVARVGSAIGVVFQKDKFFDDYRAKVGRSVLSVEYQRYNTLDERNGRRFIGCGVNERNCGAGSPCDSVQEAIAWFMKRKRK